MSLVIYDFQHLDRLEPEALGEPGQRTFRLLVENNAGLAVLWAEKQHLQGLATAIDQLLEATPDPTRHDDAAPTNTRAGVKTTLMMRASRFELGMDRREGGYVLQAYDVELPQGAPAIFTCRPTRDMLAALTTAIMSLAAAGRPRCPICGQPIEAGRPHDHGATTVL